MPQKSPEKENDIVTNIIYGDRISEIGGAKAASGTLVATQPNHFSGTLGGVRIHFTLANANTSALRAAVRQAAVRR